VAVVGISGSIRAITTDDRVAASDAALAVVDASSVTPVSYPSYGQWARSQPSRAVRLTGEKTGAGHSQFYGS